MSDLRLGIPLPDHTLRLIGEMVIVAAIIDTQLSNVVGLLEVGPKQDLGNGQQGWRVPQRAHHVTNINPRSTDLRKLSAVRNDSYLDKLVTEFRWAMARVSKTRNFISHGMLAGTGEDQLFWSQRKLKQMTLKEAVATAPIFHFAWRVLHLINWHLVGIEPPFALPDRPA